MILVDSSVWIAYFNGTGTPQTARLDVLLGNEDLAVGDLILAEVLQGFRTDRDFNHARSLMASLTVFELGVERIAVEAARNFRRLRALGITVRKTVDTMIATWCIENGCELLHADRDFDAFEAHLGLSVVD